MRRRRVCAALLSALLLYLSACAAVSDSGGNDAAKPAAQAPQNEEDTARQTGDAPQEAVSLPPRHLEAQIINGREEKAETDAGEHAGETRLEQSGGEQARTDSADASAPSAQQAARCVVIDPGHQENGNFSFEPIGPGASEEKVKVAAGTAGVVSGLYEYELTLQISLLLKEELAARGYAVILTRESHDVDISNAERAQIANEAQADAFLRIHANGSENSAANGAMTICQTAENPYNGALYEKSYALSVCVLDALTEKTGCKKEYVWQTDSMSGINWAQMPVTIVEVGYMTNPEEDALLATQAYQKEIASGIADGVEAFFAAEMENGQ